MDFRFTPEEEGFRQEIRTFLHQELPPDWDYEPFEESDEEWRFSRAFVKKLAQKGWVAPAWPREYGGMAAPYMHQLIMAEEMAYHRAPLTPVAMAIGYLGPSIIVFGSDEQKRQHLPGITSGDVMWCQGYSEPNAGSDLASLQARAVKDGDDYVINGQKTWSSGAHRADWCFFLARTDPEAPKHKGISYFLVDMKTPGISVQPLINLADLHGFNDVYFDNVRLPRSGLLGEENRGWYVAMATLDFERSNVSGAAAAQRRFEELVAYCRENKTNGKPAIKEPTVRHKMSEMAIEIEVGRYISYRVASIQARGQIPNYEASIAKIYHSELTQRLARTGISVLGLYGQLHEDSKWAHLKGRLERAYLTTVGQTIAAGTSEVQRNIIATRGLGLPRD
ncbi:MAG: acyl-CoA dehydrogenase family protein [Chloroflexota bacterium]|nr:acyl-CoA dehydrogenase family protein [Chloroflexota bacterium]